MTSWRHRAARVETYVIAVAGGRCLWQSPAADTSRAAADTSRDAADTSRAAADGSCMWHSTAADTSCLWHCAAYPHLPGVIQQ